MADRYTTSGSDEIRDGSVSKDELNLTNTPSDGDIIQINMPAGDFTAKRLSSLDDHLKLEDNIMLNAFRVAINGSLTQQNMVDGIVDEYEDESGIDTVNSLNESYNSTNDYYSPVKLTTPFTQYKCNETSGTTVTDDGTGANNGTASVDISNLTITGKINDAFEFNGTTEYINIDALEQNIDSDTSGSISLWVKIASGGGAILSVGDTSADNRFAITVQAGGKIDVWFRLSATYQWRIVSTTALSVGTWYHVILTHNGTEPILYINNTDETNFSVETDKTVWFSDAETLLDNARIACQNHSGAGNLSFYQGAVDDIRYYQNYVLSSAERTFLYNSNNGTESSNQTQNLTLISDTFTAEAQPDSSRVVLLEENVDTITLNTDLKVYTSRDGGSSWVEGTLADEGDYDASKQILVADFDFTTSGVGAGTDMKYKLETANNKDLKIHATSLNWD